MEPRLETTTLLLFLPHSPPKPQIKTSTAALGYSQAGTPSPGLLRSATLPPGPARSASLFQHAAGSGARALPGRRARSSRGRGWRLGILNPSPLNPLGRVTTALACSHRLPANRSLKRNQRVPARLLAGAVQMLRGGGLGKEGAGEAGAPACEKQQPSPTARFRLPRYHSAMLSPALQGAAGLWPVSQPWSLAPISPWPACPQKQKAEGQSPCRLQKSPYATHPNCFCPYGSWPWWSGDWWR